MRNYMIYKLENFETEDEVMNFYLPERGNECDDLFRRKAHRLLELQSLKNKGYLVTGVLYVDKETYLNARLDVVVKDFCKADKNEQEVKMNRHLYTQEVLCKTLEIIREQKWTAMKRIASLVRRLMREDFSVNNEIAIQLYDKYLDVML